MPGTGKKIVSVFLFLLLAGLTAFLIGLPGPESLVESPDFATSRAEVVETDDSGIETHGIVEYGTQHLRVRLPDGSVKDAENVLRAQMDLDKKFRTGDTALVVIPENPREGDPLVARDYWRLGWAGFLFAAFSLFLVVFAGWTGLRSIFTFFFSCLAVWKILVPAVLAGRDPVWVSFAAVAVMTAVIIFLVAGFTRKGFASFTGSMLGVFSSLAMAAFFTDVMNINGGTMPSSQQLLHSSSSISSLRDIFVGAIVLASSGAVMDLAMDIAAGLEEVKLHNQGLGFLQLFKSGCRIGRAVVGTMTTTLLLAYSGGYITLLMVFAAEGVAPQDFLNSALVSAEIVKTLVGSFGLVLVAPFTALAGAFFFSYGSRNG